MPALCRDCLNRTPETPAENRCAHCGSQRVLAHPELERLTIAHVDCDAFYAAVEKRDDPALADRPVIVGGGRRGVVSTACYIARIHGVRSAMPMFKALKLCPDAVVLRPRMEVYVAASRDIRAAMLSLTPLVEPLSLDEAFLDLTGTERLHGAPPAAALAGLARKIATEIGVTVSVGLSHCKFLAKTASDLDKPRGFSVIGAAESLEFIAPRPIGSIWGVGAALEARLRRDGIDRVGDLRAFTQEELMQRYGSIGRRLHELAFARDARRVDPRSEPKSISSETTFAEDIANRELLKAHLWRLSEKVSARCKAKGLGGRTVTLKLKDSRFRGTTRAATLDAPVSMADTIFRHGARLLVGVPERPFRLIGIGVSALAAVTDGEGGSVPDLLDPEARSRERAERAVDALRARFGEDVIASGRSWRLRE